MSENKTLEARYWIHTVTPLHVGAGRGLGYIDLPIAREKVTNWPYIPGSSVKGVLSDHYKASGKLSRNPDRDPDDDLPDSKEERKLRKLAFGTTTKEDGGAEGGNAGALVFTDAHLLCLPVRSFYGTFAWISSSFCLERFERDLQENITIPNSRKYCAVVAKNSALVSNKENDATIYLEDLDLEAAEDDKLDDLANEIAKQVFANSPKWQETFKQRFAVVDDDVFTFLCETGTEVTPHIRIDEATGIVVDGALWYEETLPVETILTGQVWCDKVYGAKGSVVPQEELFAHYCCNEKEPLLLQMGGKASTGKGRVRCIFGPVESR